MFLQNIEKILSNEPKFRLKQANQAIYVDLISSWDKATIFPNGLREKLNKEYPLEIKAKLLEEKDGKSAKALIYLKDELKVETVLMRHQDGRNTVCVSSMVGCPVGCTFCATGTMGFIANLTSDEIAEQVLFFARRLKKEQQKITNIVFMGMGEPLLNLKNVLESIDIFTDSDKMAMSPSRVTISTSGIVQPMKELFAKDFKGRIALSLHAPTQALRESIMPIAKNNHLDKLMELVDQYINKTNKRISFEYILLKNINDKQRHAEKLAQLVRGKLIHLNLIPYNPVPGFTLETSDRKQIDRFSAILTKARVPHTVRVSMGQDIDAACGQLATKKTSV